MSKKNVRFKVLKYTDRGSTIKFQNGYDNLILTQSKRDKFFDSAKEFIPQKLDTVSLIKARKSSPIYWIWENAQIRRVRFNPSEQKLKRDGSYYKLIK